MQRKFRVLSAIAAGGLALTIAAISVSSGTSQGPTRSALAVRTQSFQAVNLGACPVLQTGYPTGACVAQVQTDLNTIKSSHLIVDGTFGSVGSQTYNAVIAFQGAYGLRQDGMVGPDTKKALEAAVLLVTPATHSEAGPTSSQAPSASN